MSKSEPVREINLLRQKEFDLYCIWKSLPPMIISPTKNTVDEVIEQLRIDDEVLIELAHIRNQTEFAQKFDLSIDTLTDWNKLIRKRDTLADIRVWAKKLTKNVMLSMYSNAMSKGGTSFKDRENFIKVIEGWNDKLDIKHEAGDTLADLLRQSLNSKPQPQHGNDTTGDTTGE